MQTKVRERKGEKGISRQSIVSSAQRVLLVDFIWIAVWKVWESGVVVTWPFQKGPICWMLAQGYLLLQSKLEVFPTLCKSRMLFKSSLDKTRNRRK